MQDRLKLAGMLALANALLIFPLSRLVSSLSGHPGFGPMLVSSLGHLIGYFLFLYVFSALKLLLNRHFKFHGADPALTGLIALYTLYLIANLLLNLFPSAHTVLEWVATLLFIGIGAALFFTGLKLLSVPGDLFGMGRWTAAALMVMGACLASIWLAKYGILVGVVAYILIGVVLSKGAHLFAPE